MRKKTKKKNERSRRKKLEKNREFVVINDVRMVLKRTKDKCLFHKKCGHIYVVATQIESLKGKMKICKNTLDDLQLYAQVLKNERDQ